MSDVNSVCVSGNLAMDPEQGNGVLRFCVAVNRSVKNEDGGWHEDASFVDCKVFGNRAQALSGILAKGMQVTVQGELRQERWQDQQTGENRSKLVVVAREVKLPPRPKDGQQPAAQQYRPQPYAPQQYQTMEYRSQPAPQQYRPAQYQQHCQPQQPMPGTPPAQPAPSVYDDEIPF